MVQQVGRQFVLGAERTSRFAVGMAFSGAIGQNPAIPAEPALQGGQQLLGRARPFQFRKLLLTQRKHRGGLGQPFQKASR